ncbi:2087_t:CDS:2 [Funneliformis geosporum]|uniref:12905_t:CDS:1 n=1 Tax=Funneliformis geosporum TaxID=1117311 RepID=A0A9W4SVI6_9GLOM|nr:2087_t:CDS:2 [Funneliformis geosporum]CAI2182943.1 12905_t:CDS:2 [Funneliformis geosporum]
MSEVEEIHIKMDDNTAHNGEQITLLSVSPNGKHVITYSSKDRSIEGWIVDFKCAPLKRDPEMDGYPLPDSDEVNEIKVNDEKFVLYAWENNIRTFQISNNHPIKVHALNLSFRSFDFKNNGDLVLQDGLTFTTEFLINVYSQTRNGLMFTSKHIISIGNNFFEEVSSALERKVIIKDDKVWIISPDYLFQWDLNVIQFEFSYSLEFDGKDVEDIIMRKFSLKSKSSIEVLSNYYIMAFNIPNLEKTRYKPTSHN